MDVGEADVGVACARWNACINCSIDGVALGVDGELSTTCINTDLSGNYIYNVNAFAVFRTYMFYNIDITLL